MPRFCLPQAQLSTNLEVGLLPRKAHMGCLKMDSLIPQNLLFKFCEDQLWYSSRLSFANEGHSSLNHIRWPVTFDSWWRCPLVTTSGHA
jgi:hypothetical protein